MTYAVWLKAVTLWVAILLLAIANGALREKVLVPAYSSNFAYLASGVILSGCIFVVAYVAAPWFGALATRQWWLVGLVWLLLTLLFEFSFGRLMQNKSWAELWQAYTFQGGNIWPIVLVVTTVSPWLSAKLRGFV